MKIDKEIYMIYIYRNRYIYNTYPGLKNTCMYTLKI